jgi:hypothetical protein
MISIFFVAGMFGSSIEYMLRMYSNNFLYPVRLRRNQTNTAITGIQSDGSMHGFRKELHIGSLSAYGQNIDVEISTPTYPTPDGTLLKILKVYPFKPSSVNVLLYADSLRAAEINILFQYHKIAVGAVMKFGLGIFSNGHENENDIVNWNNKYTHWSQMQPWEWREWMSLFYTTWVQEWINSQHEVPDNFLKISNTEMLFQPKDTITRIFDFCNVPITGDLDLFVNEWAEKQQYVIDEFNVLDDICNNTINNIAFSWEQLHIVASAIVQQRLRSLGYEIRCDGLNTFPTDSATLYSLLERC